MKKVACLIAVISMIVLSSCISNSDWGKVIIPADEKLVFSEPDSFYGDKYISVVVGNDTMIVNNHNQVYKICYIKTAFPEKDIVIEYVKIEEKGKIILDPRFINVK